jgi:hypothetical protein
MGIWLIWVVLALPGFWGVSLGAVVPLLAAGLLRKYLSRTTESGDWPERLAWVPVVCVLVALLGYGLTLSLVQAHYFARRSHAYDRKLEVIDKRLGAQAVLFKKEAQKIKRRNTKVNAILDREAARSPRPLTKRESGELARLESIIVKSHGNPSRAFALLQGAHFSQTGRPGSAAHSLLLAVNPELGDNTVDLIRRSLAPAPEAKELPPWFGRLGGFFTVATQLLAGLVIVLAFGRWRTGTSEAVFRTAMPVAVFGIAFGLAGNLPSLSRHLQAILLAPVVAGLACAIGALIVTAIAPPHQGTSN